ncbi:SymE family type I addiction module toxin [Pectobacterium brasiliense]|uniref:SymE family type I addiction module toxin n=1 Tax=Pectobacterium brasiliense TaxID=180957 RepID=UPI003B289BC7
MFFAFRHFRDGFARIQPVGNHSRRQRTVAAGFRPQLKLSGKWLENISFNTGQPVIVNVEQGQLLIRPAAE